MSNYQRSCLHCNLDPSECVCEDSTLNALSFSYLEDGQWVTLPRTKALEARKEGLAKFQEHFERYIEEDSTSVLYRWAMKALEAAPLYFWVVPSSSSGKYHPPFSQGYGGLVRHVFAVMYMTRELATTFELTTYDERPVATIAAALHDICKYGLEYNPRYFGVHECLVRVKLGKKNADVLKDCKDAYTANRILAAVETHNGNLESGEWTAFRLPPQDKVAQVVHLADYVVSRKKFHFEV